MRCSMCGHDSPGGSSFCLNCGNSLAQTPLPPPGLPGITVCVLCRGENPPGMKYCRSCGSALTPSVSSAPAYAGPVARAAPMGGPMPGMPSGPVGGFPSTPVAGVPAFGPLGAGPMAPMGAGLEPTVPPSMAPQPVAVALGHMQTSIADPLPRAQGSLVVCPRCSTQTPVGFAFCQQCGYQMQSPPSDLITNHRGRSPSAAPPIVGKYDAPIDPHGGTVAQQDDGPPPAAIIAARAASRPVPAAAWGTAVLVNRDGSDGQRYPLAGEYLVFGRAGADIAFDDDRFLARQHARIERAGDGGVRILPLDALNGVFRKIDAPVELADGMTILLGREVLRYEKLDAEEAKGAPLVRHGVALFGSPPRDPWGRLIQLVPSGGYRDVRHLTGEEIVLGREEGDIVFRDDAFMSRRHAAVTWDGRRALLTDLGSSNGTFLRLTGPVALRHGDHVRMGDQLLRVELGR
jgi:pSer/pThr/pTyr-binding forkhead associated (FHA) protein/ribosomal protein L40E